MSSFWGVVHFQNPAQYGAGYDWYDAMLRTASIQNYSVSLTAGKDKFTTSAILGYFGQEGVVFNSNLQRISLRLNSNYNVTDKVQVGVNLAPSYTIDHTPATDGQFFNGQGLLYNALLSWPTLAYRNADGSLPPLGSGAGAIGLYRPQLVPLHSGDYQQQQAAAPVVQRLPASRAAEGAAPQND